MTQAERNNLIFEAAVEDAIERRAAADKALHRLYSVADDLAAMGGYCGKYADVFDVFCSVVGMDDVESALDDAARGRRNK